MSGHRGSYGPTITPSGLAMLEVGQKTVTLAATPETLVDDSLPCTLVWVGAPYNKATGAATNTKPVNIGDATEQYLPVMPSNFEGLFLPCLDAVDLVIDVGADGEDLNYVIFG